MATTRLGCFQMNAVVKVRYIGLRKWMISNKVTIAELERRCGGERTFYHCLISGRHAPSKKTIDAILRTTGLTYEECFKEDKHAQN